MCVHPDRRVERFCENMQTRFLADPPTQPTDNDEVRSAVASRLQTSGSKNTDNGSRENAKQSLLEFNPHHLCGRAKFVGMIFHLINDVETDFEEELPGIPQQVARLSLSVSVTRPAAAFFLRFKQIKINFLTPVEARCVVYALRESAVNKIHFAR